MVKKSVDHSVKPEAVIASSVKRETSATKRRRLFQRGHDGP